MLNKTFFSAILALTVAAPALADSDVTAERAAQNTPEGWPAVALPQIAAITKANTIDITAYGAKTSSADNTKAIQAALDAVPDGGGMVVVPAGTWLCGPIRMKSHTVLHLAKGAMLKLLPMGQYPVDEKGNANKNYFLSGQKNATDLIIEGEDKNCSVIDGQGAAWWAAVDSARAVKEKGPSRAPLIRFDDGSRFLVRNLTLQNSPGVNLTIGSGGKGSDGTVHDIIIREPSSYLKTGASHNTDGIPIWAPRVNVYNCNISNGDDNVVVDSNGQYVHVWNCQFGEGHGASIGSYTVNVHDVLWENITFKGTDSGFRLKSQRGRSGDVYNITMRNCTMTGVRNPVYIECWYDKSKKPLPEEAETAPLDEKTPRFHDILIQNVLSVGTKYTKSKKNGFPIFIYGLPESPVKNVTLDNVRVSAGKGAFMAYYDNVKFVNGTTITNTSDPSKTFEVKYPGK